MPSCKQAIQSVTQGLKEGLRKVIEREPTGLRKPFRLDDFRLLLADVTQEFDIQVVPAVGDDVADAEELQVGDLDA